MAHIVKRKDRPGYLARWKDPSGRERSKSFRRKTDAETHLLAVESAKTRGEYFDPKNAKRPFGEILDAFRVARGGSRSTRARDESSFKVHILPVFGSIPIGVIQRSDVQIWVNSLSDKGLAPSTVEREYESLQKVFTWAVDEELIVRSPCRKIRVYRHRDSQTKEQRFYTPQEVEALYNSFDPRFKAMVLVGCYAGLRVGEMAALRKDRILFLRRQIDVVEGLTEVSGSVYIGALKTKHSRGRVDIPQFLADELAAHIAAYPPGKDGLVFTAPEGGPLRPNGWRRRFWHPAARSSIGEPARPHDMRHTFVSILIDQGISVERVCEQARHSDPAFTWRTYRHRFDTAREDTVQALENARNAGRIQEAEGNNVGTRRFLASSSEGA